MLALEQTNDFRGESPLEPVYPFDAPDSPIVLYRGPIGGVEPEEQPGVVELVFGAKPKLRWNIERRTGLPSVDFGGVDLHISRRGRDWTLAAHYGGAGTGWINGVELAVADARLHRVLVHWLNLPGILGTATLERRTADDQRWWQGRWQLDVEGWTLTLDSRPDHHKVFRDVDEGSVYVLTHVMELRRTDDTDFTPAEARAVLECLRVCFSFGFGHWVAPALPVGYDSAGHVAWEEWSSPICEPAHRPSSGWLYWGRPEDAAALVRCALPAFKGRAGEGTTRLQMVLAVQAVQTGFVEQRILVVFPALENLAWITLVLGGSVPPATYRNTTVWPGEKRLRRLLDLAQIPADVDTRSLPALARFAAAENLSDGPAAIVRVRNRLIHPQKPDDEIFRHEGLTRDVWYLSRHYLTLLILHSIGYGGEYMRQMPPFGWVGNTEPVPWR
jgi:hypothetical protein